MADKAGPAEGVRRALNRNAVMFGVRRFAALVFLSLGITMIIFLLSLLAPDPTAVALGEDAASDPATVAAFRERHGLDKPIPERYLAYTSNLLRGDLGLSTRTNRPVSGDLFRSVPASIELALAAITVTLVAGIGLGLLAGINRERLIDQGIRLFSLGGISLPTFYLAILAYYLFFFRLGIAPSGGRLGPLESPPPTVTGMFTIDSLLDGDFALFKSAVHHMIMPALVLASTATSIVIRFVRSAVLDVLESDFVAAARAKGLPESQIVRSYVLRAAIIPVLTLLGIVFAGLLSGAVLTETIFSWPGLGRYAFLSTSNLDTNGILGVSLVIGLIYVSINFLVDIMYGFVDPRIRQS